MKKIYIVIISLNLIGLVYVYSLADEYYFKNEFPSDMNVQIISGIDELHMGEYGKCLETFKNIQKEHPDHVAGYFFYGAALEWMMVDYRNYSRTEEFKEVINKAIDMGQERVEKNKDDPWAYFFRGAAYGFKALLYSETGSLWKAYTNSKRCNKDMKRALKLKKDLWDAYYAFGMYHFWKGYYSRHITWLPLIRNSKKRGIKEVRIAMEKGTYVDVEAASSLVRIHFVEKKYKEAIETAETILKDFPDYLYCYWYIADSYIKLEDYSNAIKTLEWIKVYFEGSDLDGSIALLEVKYKLGRIYYETDEYQKALEYLEEAANGRSVAPKGFSNINKYPALAEKLIKKILKKQK